MDNRNTGRSGSKNSKKRKPYQPFNPQPERGARPSSRTKPTPQSRAASLPSDYKEQERQARLQAEKSTTSRPNSPAKPPAQSSSRPQATPPRPRTQASSSPAPARSSSTSSSSSSKPAAQSTTQSTSTPKPETKKGESAGMAEWRAKFPKLAAVLDKKNATRGTSKTDNPLMKGMTARMKQREDAAAKAAAPKTESSIGPVKDGKEYASKIETKGVGPVKDGGDYASKLETKGIGPVKDGGDYASSLTINKGTRANAAKTFAEIAAERKRRKGNK